MAGFIKGIPLSQGFFHDCAKPILSRYFPELVYSAGILGYGSDVLGYDDEVSTDHMWGPRFYLFVQEGDYALKDVILQKLSQNLPVEYCGYATSFSEPDAIGVRTPSPDDESPISPLIWIETPESFIRAYLGAYPLDGLSPFDWLTLSEHRLLGFTKGRLFHDGLRLQQERDKLRYYPLTVKLYLIASQWATISEEEAFVRRCGDCGDEIGSRLITGRIAERLMRLCFLYEEQYAPYSKWFGTAFAKLPVNPDIVQTILALLSENGLDKREQLLIKCLLLVAQLHNEKALTEPVQVSEQHYYGRKIKVIFTDKLAQAVSCKLRSTPLEDVPLIGSMSQEADLTRLWDNPQCRNKLLWIYRGIP